MFHEQWWDHECEIYKLSCNIHVINWCFSIPIALVASIAITAIMHSKGPNRGGLKDVESGNSAENVEYVERDVEYDFFHSLLWCGISILFWWCIILLSTDFIVASQWFSYTSKTLEVPLTYLWIALMLVFMITVSCCFSCYSKIDLLNPSHAFWSGLFCGIRVDVLICLCFKSKVSCLNRVSTSPRARLAAGAFPLLVIFLITGYVVLSIVPLTLLFLLHRIHMTAFYVYILAAFLFIIFSVTEGNYERRIRKKHAIDNKLREWKEQEIARRKQTALQQGVRAQASASAKAVQETDFGVPLPEIHVPELS